MKQPVRSLACLLASAVVCSAAAVEAQPVLLTEVEMDGATAAGLRSDLTARLATVKSRLEQLRARLTEHQSQKGAKSQSRSWTVTNSDGSVTTHVRVTSSYTYSN